MSYRTALATALSSVVGPCAEQASRHGRFPRASVAGLGRAGLLGLTASAELGGGGLGMEEAAEVVAQVAGVCPATGAVLRSHYAAVAVIEAYGIPWVRHRVATGQHLSTLALADECEDMTAGTAAHRGSATRTGGVVALAARKRDVAGAGEADSYVWLSKPVDGREGLTLWLVQADAPGLFVPARPDGNGPRGSATSSVRADPVLVPACSRLGPNGGGLDIVLETILPWLATSQAGGAGIPQAVRADAPV